MRRHSMLRAARLPLCLAALLAGAAPAAAQGGDQAAAFFDRFGFQETSAVPGGHGGTRTIYRPAGVWSDEAQLELQARAGGEVVSVEILVSRRLLTDDPAAAHDLVAAYLETAVPFEDEHLVAPLRGMILSDDPAVRRGENERNRGCCALPPVPKRDIAAVAVVDGRSAYALVRLEGC